MHRNKGGPVAAHKIQIKGQTFYEDHYRLETRDLGAAVRYLEATVSDLLEAGIGEQQLTVRAELDAAPYSIEIEVYATEAQATAIGWTIPPDSEDAAA
jgi:hypothetical protein